MWMVPNILTLCVRVDSLDLFLLVAINISVRLAPLSSDRCFILV